MNEVYRDVEQHISHLRGYARAITRNSVAADDLVQESLARALAKSHSYQPGTNLRAWLFTVLRNQHVSDMRRDRRTGTSIDPDDAAAELSIAPNQESRLTLIAVAHALAALPRTQRILIELAALEGQSYEHVAESCSIPLGTVKSRIARGRRRLRETVDGSTRPKEIAPWPPSSRHAPPLA